MTITTTTLTAEQTHALREIADYVEMADSHGAYDEQNTIDDGYAAGGTIASLTIDALREVAGIGSGACTICHAAADSLTVGSDGKTTACPDCMGSADEIR